MAENNSNIESLLREHLQQDKSRLDRIEDKIDRLSDTVVAIARAEEKLITLESARSEVGATLEDHENRLDRHEARLQDGDVTLNTITKVFWTIVTAALGALTLMYIGK